MFTGLVQSLAEVSGKVDDGHGGCKLSLEVPSCPEDIKLGESLAVSGVCLSVVAAHPPTLTFEVGPETMLRTTLGRVTVGEKVNLERALSMNDRLGGHFVTGHVDCVGTIQDRTTQGDWQKVWFAFEGSRFDDLLVIKGSIAVDGVSLTLVDVEPGRCSVMLIPQTISHTTLGLKGIHEPVNLEFDVIAKHVQKLFQNLTIEL